MKRGNIRGILCCGLVFVSIVVIEFDEHMSSTGFLSS